MPLTLTKPWHHSTGVRGAAVSLLGSSAALLQSAAPPHETPPAHAGAPASAHASAPARLALQNWRLNAAAPLAPLAMAALSAALPQLAGCAGLSAALSSPSRAYVASDRATYEAVAPEYAAYVDSDQDLDDAAKARRQRTLETWRVRIESAE